MPWYAWVLLALFAWNIVYQWYLVDRVRETQTHLRAFLATIKLGFYIWAVIALAQVHS